MRSWHFSLCTLTVTNRINSCLLGKCKGSSAQNSSSVHWCSRLVRFNEVPEKVPKVPESSGEESGGLWCRARSGSTGFWRRFRTRFQEALVQSQVRFNRVPEKVPERFRRRSGAFGAEPGQVQQGSGEGFGEGWCRARSGWTRFRRRSGRLWCRGRPGSTGFRRRFQKRFPKRSGRLWCRARSDSTGFPRRFGAEPGQVQQGSGEGSGEGLGGFGAERGQVERGWEKVPENVPRNHGAMVQSQVRFNRSWRRLQRRSQRRFWES